MEPAVDIAAGDLRARTRDAVRADIAGRALVLFDENGFDATTVDDVAVVVGISARSFFRYFPVKEDVVIGDPLPFGTRIRDALRARPIDEDPWASLRGAFAPIIQSTASEVDQNLRLMRVMMSAASLRARNHEKHLVWASMLVPIVVERLTIADATERAVRFQAETLVHGALACLDVALAEWTAVEAGTPIGTLLDRSFAALRG